MRILLTLSTLAGAALTAMPAAADPGERFGGIPSGHLPPPGECRAWIPGVPPGQQPPPTRCGFGQGQAGERAYRGGLREEERIRDYFLREFVRRSRERDERELRDN